MLNSLAYNIHTCFLNLFLNKGIMFDYASVEKRQYMCYECTRERELGPVCVVYLQGVRL